MFIRNLGVRKMRELEVQKYLRANTLEDLIQEYKINVRPHDTLPLVNLNYDQIESPRNVPITNECRGLVLEKDSWAIVAKSFDRFFNLGEFREVDEAFDWDGTYSQDKEDGSLMLMWRYKGVMYFSTRGSFANQSVNVGTKTWTEFCWEILDGGCAADVFDSYGKIDNRLTLIFEFCSPYNKVVRRYDKPQLFLLSAFDSFNMEEEDRKIVDDIAKELGVARPNGHHFRDIHHLQSHLNEMSLEDKTYEGVVVRDKNNKRLKVKTLSYLSLHRLHGNGNLFNPKNLVPFLWDADLQSEALAYFPEVKDNFNKLNDLYKKTVKNLENYWFCYWDEKSQKKFAQAVTPCPLSSILFLARKSGWDVPQAIKSEQGQKVMTNYLVENMK